MALLVTFVLTISAAPSGASPDHSVIAQASFPVNPGPKPTTPEKRILDEYPAFVRPFLKYGVGGAIAIWFIFGIGWLCRQKWRLAQTEEAKKQARNWITGMLVGVVIALSVVGVGFVLWLRNQHLATLFVAGPVAVLLPPLLASWWSRPGGSAA